MTTFEMTDKTAEAILLFGQDNPVLAECSLKFYRGFRAAGIEDPSEAGSKTCDEMLDLLDLLPEEPTEMPAKDKNGNPIHFTDKEAITAMKVDLPEQLHEMLEYAYWKARSVGLGINLARTEGLRAVSYALAMMTLKQAMNEMNEGEG